MTQNRPSPHFSFEFAVKRQRDLELASQFSDPICADIMPGAIVSRADFPNPQSISVQWALAADTVRHQTLLPRHQRLERLLLARRRPLHHHRHRA